MPSFPPTSPRFEAWVASAGARPALWRIAACLALAALVWIAALAGLVALGRRIVPAGADAGSAALLIYLASFAGLLAGLCAGVRLLHGRSPASLAGPAQGVRLLAGIALGAAFVLAAFALALGPLALIAPPERQLSLAAWAAALPLALPLVLVQAAAEEVVFRGYLQTQLAARFRSALIWWLAPALVFGALHWNPAEFGANAALVAAAAALMGLALGDVTARTGSLGLAIGLHFANNALAMLIIASPSALSGLALYLSPFDPGDPAAMRATLLGNIALIGLAYGGWLWWAGRRARAAAQPRANPESRRGR
ncbi:hypothetical protein BH23PSE1_BH23PSE1_12100 [soil metagenome]